MRYLPLERKEVIDKVKHLVKKKYYFRKQNLTAEMIADEIGISRSALLKIFKEEMDITFLEYVNKCRVQHSRKLVVGNHGKHTMEYIQIMSGFGSLHSFYKKYKEAYREAPYANGK